ncbi:MULTISPECIES: hypothetical protein [unclassified Lysinibacillus]|uniref:hypothetical protein n=1 Tax=unclassified Lysinibacillus TaxID=2636778 RepID=UPI002011E792|nr:MULTISPECIES: hypothetical protein [unclassified Lysinibacillus]MCL1695557.1 hypothetical protein [Lysinibacillus sp. BPa_S21]MCL1700199.1 hypothetical protein [Lysinibacillus sp. Bpr_S20]
MAEVGSHDYEYVEAGTIDVKDLPPLDATTNKIMKDEFTTGFSLTVFYFILIFSIPVMNWFAPELAFKKILGGMTVTWFVTTVVMMVMAFIIAYVHTALYEKRLKKYEILNK